MAGGRRALRRARGASTLCAGGHRSLEQSLEPACSQVPVHVALQPHRQAGMGLGDTGAPCSTSALSPVLSFPTPQEEYQEYEPEA